MQQIIKANNSKFTFIDHIENMGKRMVESNKLRITRRNPLPRHFTLIIVLMLVVVLPLLLILPLAFGQSSTQTTSQTTTQATTAGNSDSGIGLLAAGVAIAGSCAGAGYAVGKAASSAAAAIVERPAAFGPLLILAGLGEGIAIYGLLVAFEILSKVT